MLIAFRRTLRGRRALLAPVLVCGVLAAVVTTAAEGAARVTPRPAHDPSGVAMPVGNQVGWKQVFKDDFLGTKLDSQWLAYRGAVAGSAGGWWSASHVVVHGGELALRTYRDPAACTNAASCALFNDEVSAGVKTRFTQRYGKFLIRVRTTPVADVSFLALLWPANNQAPPETDFAQEGGMLHLTTIGAAIKYVPTGATGPSGATGTTTTTGGLGEITNSVPANSARWHTLGIIWSPGKVVYTIDGRVWGKEVSPVISTVPMNIVLQSQTDCQAVTGQTCIAPWVTTEPDVDVAWAVAYKSAPAHH